MNTPVDTRTYFADIGAWPRSSRMLLAYVSGFIVSLVLTLGAYFLATRGMLTMDTLIILGVLALVQFFAQVFLFLHLGTERSARERLVVFGFAFLIVAVIIAGSLWIMANLNGRMMPPGTNMADMLHYMDDQNGGI